jgi:DNA-binding PadR family transcriptional regulator
VKDPAREIFVRLMAKVQELETRIRNLEQEIKTAAEEGDEKTGTLFREELKGFQNELANYRNELARLSDGCGNPHAM